MANGLLGGFSGVQNNAPIVNNADQMMYKGGSKTFDESAQPGTLGSAGNGYYGPSGYTEAPAPNSLQAQNDEYAAMQAHVADMRSKMKELGQNAIVTNPGGVVGNTGMTFDNLYSTYGPGGSGTTIPAQSSPQPSQNTQVTQNTQASPQTNNGGLTGFDASVKGAQDSVYKQALSRLDPIWSNNQKDLENQLTQQGIMRNSEAWNRAMDDFGRNKNDAYSSAFNNSFTQGLNAQNQGFTQGLADRTLAQQGALAGRGLDLQDKSITQQGTLANRGLDLQSQGQNFNQDFANKQFEYGKQKDAQNVSTAASNADKAGLYGLGAAALSSPGISSALNGLFTKGVNGLLNSGGFAGIGQSSFDPNSVSYTDPYEYQPLQGVDYAPELNTPDISQVPGIIVIDEDSPTGYSMNGVPVDENGQVAYG